MKDNHDPLFYSYQSWKTWMIANRNFWWLDPIHDGTDQSFLFYRDVPWDSTCGCYININGKTVSAGEYTAALDHIGNAVFFPRWKRKYDTHEEAMDVVAGQLGSFRRALW